MFSTTTVFQFICHDTDLCIPQTKQTLFQSGRTTTTKGGLDRE